MAPNEARTVSSLVRALATLGVLMTVVAAFEAPISWTLRGYVLSVSLAVLGVVASRARRRVGRLATVAGALAFAVLLGARAADLLPAQNTRPVVHLPSGQGERRLGRLLPERDGVIVAAGLLGPAGFATEREREGFVPALDVAYSRYEAREGEVATPLIATVLGNQQPESFDVLRFTSEGLRTPETEVLFLHGAAGNWGLLCWLVAEAAREVGLATTCPSIGASGDWATPEGRATVGETQRWLRARGVRRVVLLALSQGAASMSAAREVLAGDLVAAGALFGYDARFQPDAPLLVVYGAHDERFPSAAVEARVARWERGGAHVTRARIEGDHFALVKVAEPTRTAIAEWLGEVTR